MFLIELIKYINILINRPRSHYLTALLTLNSNIFSKTDALLFCFFFCQSLCFRKMLVAHRSASKAANGKHICRALYHAPAPCPCH